MLGVLIKPPKQSSKEDFIGHLLVLKSSSFQHARGQRILPNQRNGAQLEIFAYRVCRDCHDSTKGESGNPNGSSAHQSHALCGQLQATALPERVEFRGAGHAFPWKRSELVLGLIPLLLRRPFACERTISLTVSRG